MPLSVAGSCPLTKIDAPRSVLPAPPAANTFSTVAAPGLVTKAIVTWGKGRSRKVHDAIVVGARCAGASTAMLLARKGYRVLLVDRAALPSDIPHGHFIHRHGDPGVSSAGVCWTAW
jgi:hypothetical protein